MTKWTILAGLIGAIAIAASAEDSVKTTPDAKPSEPVYQPLILPDQPLPSGVPAPRKEIVDDKPADPGAAHGAAAVRPMGILLVPDGDKDKKRELWIYTLPQEEVERAERQKLEDRRDADRRQLESVRQLPDWAVDSQYRKYLEQSEINLGLWTTDPLLPVPEDKTSPSGNTLQDFFAEPFAPADHSAFPVGTVLIKPQEGAATDPGLLDTSLQGGRSGETGGLPKKRGEDLQPGANKPTTRDTEADRYHKPQKPL